MPRSNITTRSLTAFSTSAARVSFASAALFVILLVALHLLEPEFDPSWHFISEYQLGTYGWIMSLAFFSMMVSSVALLVAVQSQIRTVGGYVGLFFLTISAIGFGLAAFFITDPITATEASTHGMVHNTAALLGGNIPGAAYFLGWSLARNVAWISARRSLLWITGLAILGNLASFWMQAVIGLAHAKLGPGVGIGWPNRLLILAFAAWLMAFSWLVIRMYRIHPPSVETAIPPHGVYR